MYRRVRHPEAVVAASLLLLVVAGCGTENPTPNRPMVVTTIHPLYAIVSEVTGGALDVHGLLPPGASPHTYSPRPRDAAALERAALLIHVSDDMDGWLRSNDERPRLALLPALPIEFQRSWENAHIHEGESSSANDPHFWLDPLAVQAALPAIVVELERVDLSHTAEFQANGKRFAEELAALDKEIATILADVRGKSIVVHHPSWNYFCARYGLDVAGVVEWAAGRESSAREMRALLDTMKARHVKAVFTEPQLSRQSVDAVAEASGAAVYELDPLGGVPGRMTYSELLLYNARILAEALQ